MSGNTVFWLGPVGNLVPVNVNSGSGIQTMGRARGRVATTLLSGSTLVQQRLLAKRSWSLPFDYLEQDDADVLAQLEDGFYGDGPFALIDPTNRNALSFDVAGCGARVTAPVGWVADGGSVSRTSGVAPPDEAPTSSVLEWLSPGTFTSLNPGLVTDLIDTTTAPFYNPQLPVTVSLYLKAASAITVDIAAAVWNAAGGFGGQRSWTVSVGTSWQRYSASLGIGDDTIASGLYVTPRLVTTSTSANLWIAAAQVEYATEASPWQRGYGSPRVVITSDPVLSSPFLGAFGRTLDLAEV